MFNNMSIKSKMFALIIIPIIAVIVISSQIVSENYSKVNTLNDLDSAVKLSTKISALVHETQKERGMTAGYLGSKGTKFTNELPKQRELTNKRFDELKNFLKQNDLSHLKSLNSTLELGLSNMSNVSSIREQVTKLSIQTPKAIGYYTNMNAKFLNVVIEASKISQEPLITKQLVAYANYLLSKERAGIERAVGSNTFARDTFGPGMRIKFNNLISAQNSFMDNFLQYATIDSKDFYTNTLKGDDINEVNRMRDILLNAKEIGGLILLLKKLVN